MTERRDAAAAGDRIEIGDVTDSEAVAAGRDAPAVTAGRDATVIQAGGVGCGGGGAAARHAAQRERENRRRMLARVRTTWVEGVLEASLHGAALQALGLEARPEAVPDRWGMLVQEAREDPRLLPPE